MKVAVLSESPADEAAVRILTDAILKTRTQAIATYTLRTRGWPAVRKALPTVLMHLTYQTDAEGLVVVVDADGSTIHEPTHGAPGKTPPDCRICQLQGIVDEQRRLLRIVPGRPTWKTSRRCGPSAATSRTGIAAACWWMARPGWIPSSTC